jgi:hypothetical protein
MLHSIIMKQYSILRAFRAKLLMCLQEAKKSDISKILQFIGQRLDLELGTFELTEAYEEAINYSFRPGAVKTVVGILATPCEKSSLPLSVSSYSFFKYNRVILNHLLLFVLISLFYYVIFYLHIHPW